MSLVLRFHNPRTEGWRCQNDKAFPKHSISNSCSGERTKLSQASFPWLGSGAASGAVSARTPEELHRDPHWRAKSRQSPFSSQPNAYNTRCCLGSIASLREIGSAGRGHQKQWCGSWPHRREATGYWPFPGSVACDFHTGSKSWGATVGELRPEKLKSPDTTNAQHPPPKACRQTSASTDWG